MSQIKYSPGLSLGLIELRRTFEFLGKEGFVKMSLQNTHTFGFIKDYRNFFYNAKPTEEFISNGFKQLRIEPLVAINNLGQYLETKKPTLIQISTYNQWFWVKVSHKHTSTEQIKCKIDSLGNLTVTESFQDSQLTKIFKGGADTPTKIIFPNSTLNTQEYEVLEVIGVDYAILSGDFIAEEDLEIAIVGSFISDMQVPTAYKFPFEFDSVTFTLVPEEQINTIPNHIGDQEFFIARIRAVTEKLIIEDKRSLFIYKTKDQNLLSPTISSNIPLNSIVGIESVKFQFNNNTQPNNNNLVRVGWGLKVNGWSTISETNTLVITSLLDSGIIGKISDLIFINLSGWKLIMPNGNVSTIGRTIYTNDAFSLDLDTLDVSDLPTNQNSLSNQILTIIPNIADISFRFKRSYINDGLEIFDNNWITTNHKANLGYSDILLPVVDDKTYYSVEYRQHYLLGSSDWSLIPSNIDRGYLTETSFDKNGEKLSIPTYKTYSSNDISGFIELNLNPQSYANFRKESSKNNFKVEYNSFTGSVDILKLVPGINGTFQVFNQSNSLSSASKDIYIDLSTLTQSSGSFFVLQFYNNIVISDKILNIGYNYGNTVANRLLGATTLKQVTLRDISEGSNIDGGLRIECLYDGTIWSFSQNYEIGKIGEIVMFHGTSEELQNTFDENSGLGKAFGWIGHAICDGRNNTPDLRGRFVVGFDQSTTGDLDYNEIGKVGGKKEHILTIEEIPSHKHSAAFNINKGSATLTGAANKPLDWEGNSQTDNFTNNTGGGQPHENRPPYLVLAYVKRLY